MNNKKVINGLVVLGVGLLASTGSSWFHHFPVLGTANDFTMGFFDGVSAGAYCVAIFVLVRARRSAGE